MDLVRELKDVRFELNLRGYDCEAVDAFLAKLRGDVDTVQRNNLEAAKRIAELESQVAKGGGSSETEGTLRRTLVLAQRLADETEAEAQQVAAELIDKATKDAQDLRAEANAEAEATRRAAETEATSMRETGLAELTAVRDEATTIEETISKEAAKARAQARQQAAAVLEESEKRGAERVVVIEQAAQEAATAMREPIRAEVDELEAVRARLLGDISALEAHLEEQRVRVRTAVDALRVGMSGSIEDLERVAEDDELLATQPAPAHSGASGADVPVAPDVEIIDAVDAAVDDAPTVDDVEGAVRARAALVAEEAPEVEAPRSTEPEVEELSVTGVDEAPEIPETPEAPESSAASETLAAPVVSAAPAPPMVAPEVDEVVTSYGEPVVDVGPSTEPIPVIATAASSETSEADLVDLSEEPSGIFTTEVGAEAAADDTANGQVVVLGGLAAGAATGAVAAGIAADSSTADSREDAGVQLEAPSEATPAISFVDRFTEAIDVLPVTRD